MSRIIKEYANHLFDVVVGIEDIPTRNAMRVAINPDEAAFKKELNEFKRAKVSEREGVVNNISVAEVNIDDDKYFAIINVRGVENDPDLLSELSQYDIAMSEMHAGLLLVLVRDLQLRINPEVNREHLDQYVLYQQEDSGYDGHSVEDLAVCFEPLILFKIGSNSKFREHSCVEFAYYICTFIDALKPLDLEEKFLKRLRTMLASQIPLMPKENFFLTYTSSHWKHAFLEIYRALERLYVIPRVIDLKQQLHLTEPAYVIAKHCNNQLGWKRKEQDSLQRIFSIISCTTSYWLEISSCEFASGLELDFEDDCNASRSKLAEKIYLIRNQLVHQFEEGMEMDISDSDWPVLLDFLSMVVDESYSHYISELPS